VSLKKAAACSVLSNLHFGFNTRRDTMDFGRAFSYVFEDPDWLRKIGIMALISIIPIIGQLVLIGWMLRITRRVIDGDQHPLPDVDFSQDLVTGFQGWVVMLVYALPLIVLAIPSAIIDSVNAGYSYYDSNAGNGILLLFSLCFGLFSFLYGLFMAFVLPAALGNMVAKDSLGAGLRFGEVWNLLRSNPSAYLVVLLGTILSGIIGSLGLIACFIGIFLTSAYAFAINGHLYGQAYRDSSHKVTAIVPPAPPSPPAPPEVPPGY
jgi:hypothetical protein